MNSTLGQVLTASRLDPVDGRALMRHALGMSDAALVSRAEQALTSKQQERFVTLAARRRAGEPVPYIVEAREFFSFEFKVTPAVLIPRPETELLVEFTLERLAPETDARVLDLGTGSGCIAISIAKHRPRARILAVDSSAAALAVARENMARLHVGAERIQFLHSDWFDALAGQRFDLIVSNPPYVAAGDPHLAQGDASFEPRAALVGGVDGLDCIRRIINAAPQFLVSGGRLAFEHGYDQVSRCRELLEARGFGEVFSRTDLAGIERVSGAKWDDKP